MRNILASTLAFLTAAGLAHAEDPEIVVTATRAPEQSRSLPTRVEIVDQDDIERENLALLTSALGPAGVQAGGAGQQASLFLRGANSKHVLALFDGVRLNDASTPNGLYDFGQDTLGSLDRVEIVRGPASSIHGSDAIGGVVNLIPRRGGADDFTPFVEAALGSFDTARALLGASGKTGGVDYGVSGEWFDTDGYDLVPERMRAALGDHDGATITTLTGSFRRETDGAGIDALVRWRESTANYDTFSGGPYFDQRTDDPDLGNDASQTLWRVGTDLSPDAGAVFRLSGGRLRAERSEHDNGAPTSEATSDRRFLDATMRHGAGQSRLTFGVSYERDAITVRGQFSDPLDARETRIAAYGIGQTRVAGAMATASARIDDIEGFGLQPTYALGAVREAGPWRAYASLGRAFKAPTLSERFETSFFNLGNPDLAPEVSDSFEIGFDWTRPLVQAGASAYRTRIRDLIEYDFSARQNINIGRAAIDGVEAYATIAIAPQTRVRFDYAWTDARNDESGARLLRRPEHQWSVHADVHASDRLTFTADWRSIGSRQDVTYDGHGAFVTANGSVAGFGVWSMSATYAASPATSLFIRVDNVMDETYEQPAAFAGPPRAITFGLRARG